MASFAYILPLLLVLRLARAFPSPAELGLNETADALTPTFGTTETTPDDSLAKTVTAETEEPGNTATAAETSTIKNATAVAATTSGVTTDETEVETVAYVSLEDTTPRTQPPKPDTSASSFVRYSFLAMLLPVCAFAIARTV